MAAKDFSNLAAGSDTSCVRGAKFNVMANGAGHADCGVTNGTSRPFLIGVAGGTASGKTTVCRKIVKALEDLNAGSQHQNHVEIIGQECFYRTLTETERLTACRGQFNFDHPDAFDEQLMVHTMKDLMDRKEVDVPVYDYQLNQRSGMRVIKPADVILFEGILVFYYPDLRDLYNLKLFVDTDADTRLARRVLRDTKERDRQLDQILHQYVTFVKPAFEEFCLPTKKYADVIIPRGADNMVAIDLIVQHVRDLLRNGHRTVEPTFTRSLSVLSTDSAVSRPH